jgi:hypothetical protein
VVPVSCVTYPGGPALADGIAPLNLDHSAFVLVPGDRWGTELAARTVIARFLDGTLPVIVVLVNGGAGSQTELLRCVRQEWPVLIAEGTGGLADEIAALRKPGADLSKAGAELTEIVASARVRVVQTGETLDTWQQLLDGRPKDDQTLEHVWNDYRRWDEAAENYQNEFRALQWLAVWLGVIATLVAVLQKGWPIPKEQTPQWWDYPLHLTIIIIPILVSILFAFMNRFRPGTRWLLLRGGAESVKREIFTGIYSDQQRGPYRATRLGQEVDKIMKALAQSEANKAGEPKIPELKDQQRAT